MREVLFWLSYGLFLAAGFADMRKWRLASKLLVGTGVLAFMTSFALVFGRPA